MTAKDEDTAELRNANGIDNMVQISFGITEAMNTEADLE
jgi:hypothetical protein